MKNPVLDKRVFEYQCYWGCKNYSVAKKRLEVSALSQNVNCQISIFTHFEKFVGKMYSHGKYGHPVEYIGVMVDHQHIHCIFKKPWIQSVQVNNLWDMVIGEHSNLYIRTISKEILDSRKNLSKIVNYMLTQDDHHGTSDVIFFQSEGWGIVETRKLTDEEKLKRKQVREENKNKVKVLPLSRMIYDPKIKGMREETEQDRELMRLRFEEWKKKSRQTTSYEQLVKTEEWGKEDNNLK